MSHGNSGVLNERNNKAKLERKGCPAGQNSSDGFGDACNIHGMPYGVTGKHDGCRKEVPLRRFESGYGNNIQAYTNFLFSVEIIIFYYLPAVKVRRFLFLRHNRKERDVTFL